MGRRGRRGKYNELVSIRWVSSQECKERRNGEKERKSHQLTKTCRDPPGLTGTAAPLVTEDSTTLPVQTALCRLSFFQTPTLAMFTNRLKDIVLLAAFPCS